MLSLIFLAGGSGARMGSPTPKQFLLLGDKPVALHSFELFLSIPEISEIIVVCAPSYQNQFTAQDKPILFAIPGHPRQDSVYHGLQACNPNSKLIVIHDAARPFLERKDCLRLIEAAHRTGAAALATPASSTIKICTPKKIVKQTLERSTLWQMQTPQALLAPIIHRGFLRIFQAHQEVTDDVSLAEAIDHPVEIVEGSPKNFKLTTPFDWLVAQTLISAPHVSL